MDSYNSHRVDHNKAQELVLPECDRILYVLTVGDLVECYDHFSQARLELDPPVSTRFWDLPDDKRESLIQQAVKVLGWAIDGSQWNRALEDAIQYWEEEADER